MTAPVAFLDTETCGLHADRHAVWEVGLITPDGVEHQWLLKLTDGELRQADPIALDIGRFHGRHPQGNVPVDPVESLAFLPEDVIGEVVHLTHGCHLAGAVVSFDEERLRRMAWRYGLVPSWHYHLIDVEALAAGQLVAPPPWTSSDISEGVGVHPD